MSAPTSPGTGNGRDRWKATLAAGPDCLSIERLAEPDLSANEQLHVDACARCQAERALAMEFESAAETADEGAAIQWIARETKRRVFPVDTAPASVQTGWFRIPAWATGLAAAVVMVLGLVLLLRSPDTVPGDVRPGGVYRAGSVELTSPVGDVAAIPSELRWQAVTGAARYDVRVLEVDGVEVWRTRTEATSVALPDNVRAAARPFRTLMWTVVALDEAGRNVTPAATGSFRVAP